MKLLKSILIGTGGMVLAAMVLALLAPRAVQAVVATAVQVVNTSASPAITQDTSRQGSQVVTISCNTNPIRGSALCSQVLPDGYYSGQRGPNGGYLVPANQYFVLTSMDWSGSTATGIYLYLSNLQLNNYMLQAYSQISFSSGIAFGSNTEVFPAPVSGPSGTLILHGYLTSN